MMDLPTVILLHETRDGRHHDWMLANPHDPDGPLWTARVTPPPAHWHELEWWDLVPLPPHRRIYLTYEGEISNGRGSVKRVDEGRFTAKLWTESHLVIDLQLWSCEGTVEITRLTEQLWRARWV